MKDLIQSFFVALTIGVVAYCTLFVVNGTMGKSEGTTTKKEQPKTPTPQPNKPTKESPIASNNSNDSNPFGKTESKKLEPTKKPATFSVEDDDNHFYRIQLGVVSPKNANFEPYLVLKDLGNLYADPMPNGQKKMVLGDYHDRTEAEGKLIKVKQKGFKDAFIIALPYAIDSQPDKAEPEKKAPKKTAEKPLKETPIQPTDYGEPQATAETPMADKKTTTATYVIRLGVFADPPIKKLASLKDLGKVNMQMSQGDLTIVVLGPFYNRAKAVEALQEVKKRGFTDAFIANTQKALQVPSKVAAKPAAAKTTPITKGKSGHVTEYVIQLAALKNPTSFYAYKKVTMLGAIYSEETPNGITKVLLGTYYSRQNAEKALAKVQHSGFTQAFIKTQQHNVSKEGGINHKGWVKVFEKNNL